MVGSEFRKQRIDSGLSQAKLAKITGIQQSKLSAFELGKYDLASAERQAISKTLFSLDEEKIKTIKKKCYQSNKDSKSILATRPRRKYEQTSRNDEYRKTLLNLENKFHSNQDQKINAISFFAGCGGLCYGVKASGFKIVATNELDDNYKKIYHKNFSNCNFLTNDIRKITDNEMHKLIKKHGAIDLMIGGPPCQGFSLAGKRDVNDQRNTLFQNYLHLANIIKPKVILMENVKLLTSMKDPNGEYVSERILKTFNSIGYKSAFFTLNAKDFGVPQHRERVIFLGIREDLGKEPSIPSPINGNINDLFTKSKPYYTFGDAVSDLEYIESGEESIKDKYHKAVNHPEHVIRWLIDVPEGKSAHDNKDKHLRPPSGYNTTYKRQVWDEPAGTVATTYGMISGCRNVHPIATRALTTREALRLQGFPDSFKLTGKLGDIRTTIGNAVPPLLAYSLGEYIKETYIL